MTDLVSIVIPVHRRRRFLAEAVESVAGQTHGAWEVVLVDDGSAGGLDRTLARIGERGRIVPGPNRGPASARNAGIGVARGEWVLCLDEDDRLLPQALSALLEAAATEGRQWAAGRFRYIDADGRPLARRHRGRFAGGDVYAALIEGCQFGPPAVVLCRREAMLAGGGFPDDWRFAEDHALWLRIARDHPLAAVATDVAEYRVHDEQASRNWQGAFLGTLEALAREEAAARPGFADHFRRARARTALEFGDAWRHHGGDPEARHWWKAAGRDDPALASTARWRRLKSYVPRPGRAGGPTDDPGLR
ncbi:MAG: glycosyltransferase family 2 protein [Gemmatimonadales bacterium]